MLPQRSFNCQKVLPNWLTMDHQMHSMAISAPSELRFHDSHCRMCFIRRFDDPHSVDAKIKPGPSFQEGDPSATATSQSMRRHHAIRTSTKCTVTCKVSCPKQEAWCISNIPSCICRVYILHDLCLCILVLKPAFCRQVRSWGINKGAVILYRRQI